MIKDIAKYVCVKYLGDEKIILSNMYENQGDLSCLKQ